MRKLVTLNKIDNLIPIEGANFIEEAVIGGWSVVVQKGIHSVSDEVLYFEIDSFLPSTDERYASFMKFGTRIFNDVVGHRIKTKRLKGVYSQGVIMPIKEFPELVLSNDSETDYSEALGILKWEEPEVVGNTGKAKGSLPWFIQKSDQDRIQNVYNKLSNTHHNEEYVGTLKMDGSSLTVFYVMGEKYEDKGFGICSRNQELLLDFDIDLNEQSSFVKGALESDLFTAAKLLHEIFGSYYAIQGELVGPGIQGNYEKFDHYTVFAYNIFDILKGEFVDFRTFREMCSYAQIKAVPEVYSESYILRESLQEILKLADGQGLNCKLREGIVYKQLNGKSQFKAISNKFLDKQE